ncbi:serine hydrolase domain-containing protein [Psychroserpens sp. BH13MA-6]
MKPLNLLRLFVCMVCLWNCSSDDAEGPTENEPDPQTEAIYFPPLNSDTWDTKSVSELGWHSEELQPLLDFLEQKNTKSFIVLHHGKIVVEAYFNNHNQNSFWYWASAGKTLTATLSGIAQDEGLLNIDAKVSDYLGTGWTSAPLDKENLIMNKHLLSMTSGLSDETGDDVTPENLLYVADAGTRWAYHNVYVKMQDVVAQASNTDWDSYFNTRLKNKIGMNGSWIALDNLNVYWSNTRSMARFGLMIYANGQWDDQQIVSENFLSEATNTSQDVNLAYGYLWWLNGKTSYHLPQSQFEFSGELISNAPNDMFAALGKNDQKIYIVPSQQLVVVRMGESANNTNFGLSDFDNELWSKINAVIN